MLILILNFRIIKHSKGIELCLRMSWTIVIHQGKWSPSKRHKNQKFWRCEWWFTQYFSIRCNVLKKSEISFYLIWKGKQDSNQEIALKGFSAFAVVLLLIFEVLVDNKSYWRSLLYSETTNWWQQISGWNKKNAKVSPIQCLTFEAHHLKRLF